LQTDTRAPSDGAGGGYLQIGGFGFFVGDQFDLRCGKALKSGQAQGQRDFEEGGSHGYGFNQSLNKCIVRISTTIRMFLMPLLTSCALA
jgi:hypothetical protein